MKKLASILMFILCIALIGCSSKPNVSDIEEDFNRDIGGCFSEVFKLSDLKKTNGIDQGNSFFLKGLRLDTLKRGIKLLS